MEIGLTIRKFIEENFLFSDPARKIDDGTSFLDTGIVDSTGMLEIVEFLEERFGISVEDEELIPENLDSIANLTSFVNRKLQGAEGLNEIEEPLDPPR